MGKPPGRPASAIQEDSGGAEQETSFEADIAEPGTPHHDRRQGDENQRRCLYQRLPEAEHGAEGALHQHRIGRDGIGAEGNEEQAAEQAGNSKSASGDGGDSKAGFRGYETALEK